MSGHSGLPGLLPLVDGYQYDVFLSYRRSGPGNAAQWVREHFHRMLQDCLADEIGSSDVFVDLNVETGSHWPTLLQQALARSKVLVAVWSPPYFESPWCLAEWHTMVAREQAFEGLVKLVYPITYADGVNFPEDAKQRQSRSVHAVSNPYPSFRGSHRQADLFEVVREIAGELADQLASAPPWQADWPECSIPAPVTMAPAVLPAYQR
ncbi:TIR domain-containing protein [Actinokineospora sp. 24-640]